MSTNEKSVLLNPPELDSDRALAIEISSYPPEVVLGSGDLR